MTVPHNVTFLISVIPITWRLIENLTMAVAGLAAGLPDNAAVQEMASEMIRELDQYGRSERDAAPKQKSQER